MIRRSVRSHEAFERAKRVIPGGVNSPAHTFAHVGGEPLFIARGEGAYLYDIDGQHYLDFVGSWGPLILGHNHPRVQEAVSKALGGTTPSVPQPRSKVNSPNSSSMLSRRSR